MPSTLPSILVDVCPRLTGDGRLPYTQLTPERPERCEITHIHAQHDGRTGVGGSVIAHALHRQLEKTGRRVGLIDLGEGSRPAWDEAISDAIHQRCHALVVLSYGAAPIPVDRVVTVAWGNR